jgi:hypothetical protein
MGIPSIGAAAILNKKFNFINKFPDVKFVLASSTR